MDVIFADAIEKLHLQPGLTRGVLGGMLEYLAAIGAASGRADEDIEIGEYDDVGAIFGWENGLMALVCGTCGREID